MLPATELDQPVDATLLRGARVVLCRRRAGVDRVADNRAGLRIQQAVEPNDAVARLADVEISSLMCPICLGQRSLSVDSMLKFLRDPNELTGVHGLRGPKQTRLILANGIGADMLSGACQDGDMLIADVTGGKGLPSLGKLFQLTPDGDALRR